jgi:hypothetical protein
VTTFHDSSNGNRLSQKDSTGAVIDLASTGGGGGATVISAVPSATQQDWAIAGITTNSVVEAAPVDNSFIGSIVAGSSGSVIELVNKGSCMIWLQHEDVLGVAANRFKLSDRSGVILLPDHSIKLGYDTGLSRWVERSKSLDVRAFDDKAFHILPNLTTGVVSVGIGSTANNATLSNVQASATPSNLFLSRDYTQISTATVNTGSSVFANALRWYRGATTEMQGFLYNCPFRNTALSATGGFFTGMMNSATAVTSQGRLTNNSLGIGTNGGETTHRVYARDATATTAIDLGANFPANNATAAYEVFFCALPLQSHISYMIKRLDVDHRAQGRLTVNLPANTVGLAPRISATVGATAATNTAQFNSIMCRRIY